MDSYWQPVTLILLIALSAFFSASETALTSLGKLRLKSMISEGVKGTDTLAKLINNPKKMLSTLLVGNNIACTLAPTIATLYTIQLMEYYLGSGYENLAAGLSAGVLTVVILIFCDIIPKTLAVQKSESVSLFVAKPVYALQILLSPIILILDIFTSLLMKIVGYKASDGEPSITEFDLKTIVNVGHEEGILELQEQQMIHNVFDFGDSRTKDVMIPRTDISAINIDATYDEVLRAFSQEQFSRIPIFKDNLDNIVGILYLKDFIFKNKDNFQLERYMRKPFFTYESKHISELLNLMRARRISIVIVLDEHGGTAGLVSLEDIVEEIVGDIDDEYDDKVAEIRQTRKNEYIVQAIAKIDDVNERLNTNFQTHTAESIGGFVIEQLGNFPDKGTLIETPEATIVVEKTDKNRIERLRVKMKEEPKSEENAN